MSNQQKDLCTIMAVGDTSPPSENPGRLFTFAKDFMDQADLRFCQTERIFSTRGTYQLQGIAPHVRRDPECAEAYKLANFDVISTAGNHTGDWGPEAAIDTVETLNNLGIATIGSGKDIEEARKSALFEKKGIKVAFLGYASDILPQYWATEEQAGVAPVRAHTFYEPYEYQPGAPPRVITVPYEEDVQQMQEDIRKAKRISDCVVVSIHWGVHFVPKPLPDYQPIVAKAAIEAGADVILGHHPHCLQGIEAIKRDNDTGIAFYSLGNFACPRITGSPIFCLPMGRYTFKDVYNKEMEVGYTYEWTRFWAESGIAKIQVSKRGLEHVSFIPTLSMPHESGQPKILAPDDRKFTEIHDHLKWASSDLANAADLSLKDGEILIYERR